MELKPYRDDDLDELHAFVVAVIRTCYPAHYPPRAVEFFVHHHAREKIAFDATRAMIVIAWEGDRIVGTGTLVSESITRVFVDPALQGQGIGRLLMDRLEDAARARGLQRVVLDASLPAVRFYEARGYRNPKPHVIDVGEGQELRYFAMEKPV